MLNGMIWTICDVRSRKQISNLNYVQVTLIELHN